MNRQKIKHTTIYSTLTIKEVFFTSHQPMMHCIFKSLSYYIPRRLTYKIIQNYQFYAVKGIRNIP